MSDSTQNPNAETSQEGTQQDGSDDAAIAAFAAIDNEGEEPSTEETDTPADEPATDDAADAEEADPDADPEADKLIEVNGAELPLSEVVKGYQRQADYSRKMNEVGAVEKAATERMAHAERLVESAEKLADVMSEVKQYDAQMKRFETVNWQQLRAQNPAEYAALAADMQSVRMNREDAVRKAQGVEGDIQRVKQQAAAEKRGEMFKTLQKEIKGWGDEVGTKITQYAVQHGASMDEIAAWTDPKIVIWADKARRFDELQAKTGALKAKAANAPPVAKPGAPRRSDPKTEAMARLRKDNSTEAAEAAFLSRM